MKSHEQLLQEINDLRLASAAAATFSSDLMSEVNELKKERDGLLAAFPEYADPGAKAALREAERQMELVLVDNAKVRVALHHLTGLFKSLVENHEKWGDYQVAVKALAAVPEDHQSALVKLTDEKALTAELISQRDELVKALTTAKSVFDGVVNEMTFGDRFTNAGQGVADALGVLDATLARAKGGTR